MLPCLSASGKSKNQLLAESGDEATSRSLVFSKHKRVQKLRYMHGSPVKQGLVLEPQQWTWNSFRHYAYDEPGPVVVNEAQRAELRVRKIS